MDLLIPVMSLAPTVEHASAEQIFLFTHLRGSLLCISFLVTTEAHL